MLVFSCLIVSPTKADYAFVRSIALPGGYPGYGPTGIAIDSSDNVWVGDRVNKCLQEFSNDGTPLGTFGTGGQLKLPQDLAFDKSGNLLVADFGIAEFSSTGSYLQMFSTTYSGSGIATDASGNVWITNGTSILEINSAGIFLGNIARFTADYVLKPADIAIDSSQNLWVFNTDGSQNRLLEFSSSRTLIRSVDVPYNSSNGFAQMTVDSSDHIWVQGLNNRTFEFANDGSLIQSFLVIDPTTPEPSEAFAIAVDSHDNVWVTDIANNRIAEYSPVPEPASFALAIGGAIGLIAIRWHRGQSQVPGNWPKNFR